MSNLHEIIYLLDLNPCDISKSAFKVDAVKSSPGIINASKFIELNKYFKYISQKNFYIINRTSDFVLSFDNIKLQFKIHSFVKGLNPDIIHYSTFLSKKFIYFLLRNRTPTLLNIHDPVPHSSDKHNKSKRFTRKLNMVFARNYMLFNKLENKDFFNVINKKYSVNVYYSKLGVYEFFQDFNATNKVEDNYKFSLLFFGRIEGYKGLDLLLEAFERLSLDYDDIELVVAGSGSFDFSPYKNNPKLRIINQYIENSELVNLINDSNLVVCPYKDATQSGVLMTAYSLCKAVLATDVGAFSESIKDNFTGFLLKDKSVKSLCKTIEDIYLNRSKIENIENNIWNEFHEGNHSWKNIVNEVSNVYKILAK